MPNRINEKIFNPALIGVFLSLLIALPNFSFIFKNGVSLDLRHFSNFSSDFDNRFADLDNLIPEQSISFEKLETIYERFPNRFIFDNDLVVPQYLIDHPSGEWNTDSENVNCYSMSSYDMSSYFENLYDYSPVNDIGSCGFVSLIQAMSFYDTFYNDNVIPEVYDKSLTNAISFSDSKEVSPGTLRQPYFGSEYTSYYDFCHGTQLTNFQSYLSVLYNIYAFTDNVDDFESSVGAWNYQNILNLLYGASENASVLTFSDKTQNEYLQIIKSVIDSGNPAIVHIQQYVPAINDYYRHSVVAYDYDDLNIYANYGYGQNETHLPLLGGTYQYTDIYYVASLDFSSFKHSHSNNYIVQNEEYCGCNISDKIMVRQGGNWLNVPPTLYWMRNIDDPGEEYLIGFRSSPTGENIDFIVISNNQITLAFALWQNLTSSCNNVIYLAFERYPYTNSTVYNETITTISIPNSYYSNVTITSTDYGFSDSYPIDSNTSDNFHRHYLNNNFSFRTRRFRTGYIHNETIVMSCIKTGITEAFLDFAFDSPIVKLEVDMAHWRELSSEWLDSNNGIVELQVWHHRDLSNPNDTCRWISYFDFLNNPISLSRDRNNMSHYVILFSEPVYGLRFHSEINVAMNSESNRGRVCIGDLKLYLGV